MTHVNLILISLRRLSGSKWSFGNDCFVAVFCNFMVSIGRIFGLPPSMNRRALEILSGICARNRVWGSEGLHHLQGGVWRLKKCKFTPSAPDLFPFCSMFANLQSPNQCGINIRVPKGLICRYPQTGMRVCLIRHAAGEADPISN